ncbi:MAG: dihydropteroate synthase [Acidimicrobiales bacterium]
MAAPLAPVLELGERRYDLEDRALVMGILNRTPDSFFDQGATWAWDAFWARADEIVAEGADILDVGAVKAGVGPEVTEAEEMDRLLPAVAGLVERFDVPVSVDTWRAAVAAEAFGAGAVLGNDISGFSDPGYLEAAAAAGAGVVATHIRLAPRVLDPFPVYTDLMREVTDFLCERAARALAAGIPAERVVLDPGLDLGKDAEQSLQLLRSTASFAALGYPLLVATSNKDFLGDILGLALDRRREATAAANALAITLGGRLVRAHDVLGACRVRDMVAAILEAR